MAGEDLIRDIIVRYFLQLDLTFPGFMARGDKKSIALFTGRRRGKGYGASLLNGRREHHPPIFMTALRAYPEDRSAHTDTSTRTCWGTVAICLDTPRS